MIVLPAIPDNVKTAPVKRSFHLGRDTISGLSAFGAQVPVFVESYLRTWTPYRSFWNYEDGCVWTGALALYEATADQALLDFVRSEAGLRITPEGGIPSFDPSEYNIDGVQAGRVLAPLFRLTGEARYRQAMDTQFVQLESHPRTQSGNYWHKQIYPHQVWLDGLYMAQPFQTQYALAAGRPELFADTVRQFLHVEKVLKDPKTGLCYHGWDESRAERWANPETGCSPCFWGRAMGWWVMALADVYELSAGLDEAGRAEIARLLRDTATALMAARSPAGLWWQVLGQGSRDGNYEEVSASLMIAYALMKGARLGVLSVDCATAGRHALNTLCARFVTPSALDGICGVAGLGNTPYRDGSFAYYLSEKITPNDPKGVAALLMALAEGLRSS
ncbi:glycoside hydrolase family 88 protein [Asticcacaulis sp. EMRT-3]|uniref:glycoside hydrolase family 88/105 protein n=1 Tax=Asticcacaulis sp. EMRT-3 TaxID=3040349 RepID=UPI0024AED5D1|nr:glycoside hydrolase family 88 protein [Asticcacaulis sp. EMRT-3]MDI7776485.1 glycoside hydrolase family 88 protein [Asticcacaulis sp. EMRT-3]